MLAIEVKNLKKKFGDISVLESIDLNIAEGEIFGFLGPNGSGKTTAVRVINGILEKTDGEILIYGKNIDNEIESIHKMCGVMTETASLYENLTGWENLKFFGQMYEMSKEDIDCKSMELLKSLDIYHARDKKVKNYSTGMKKRLSLARSLLHDPKVLFLDEPTSGLDPESARNVSLMIKKLASERAVTVFLCTHQLKYAEEICSLYGFLNKGKLIGFGSFEDLLREKNSSIYFEIRGENIPKKYDGYFDHKRDVYRIPISGDGQASEILSNIISNGGSIYEANQSHWSLEDLYFAYQKDVN